MRRPKRNIEVFSVSVIDLLASALGAFILISIILFPYYNQHQQLEKTKVDIKAAIDEKKKATEQKKRFQEIVLKQLEDIKQAAKAADGLELCRRQETACKQQLGKTFLIIGIEWDERCDVDLNVTDPRGNKFSFIKKNDRFQDYKDSKGQLSLDMLDGPGVEIWQNPEADPGLYRVNYSLCSSTRNVTGWVIDRSSGKRCIPDLSKNAADGQGDVLIEVNRDGSTTIRPTIPCPTN